MREIKFRAWDKSKKKMFDVHSLHLTGRPPYISTIVEQRGQRILYEPRLEDVELLQYTGLKDKNGKKIYEGYIYKQLWKSKEVIGEIVYRDCRYWIQPFEHYLIGEIKFTGEVIGNIYEHPKLLEVKP